MADYNNSGALFQNYLNNPTAAAMNQSTFGSIAPPNPGGGVSSLGGYGYQAYMVPGGISVPKPQTQSKPTATQGALAAQAPAPISAAQGTPTDQAKPGFFQSMTEASAKQWNKTTGGTGEDDKRGFFERMNAKSKDQWQNFTGTGKYDASNPANQDAKGNFKAPQGAMGFEDKMNAGFGLASTIMSAFGNR